MFSHVGDLGTNRTCKYKMTICVCVFAYVYLGIIERSLIALENGSILVYYGNESADTVWPGLYTLEYYKQTL